MAPPTKTSVLALDLGTSRVGVAIASLTARLPTPLTTIKAEGAMLDAITQLVRDHQAACLVVGLPRSLGGKETSQTAWVKQTVKHLRQRLGVPVYLQDEAVTSVQAEAELRRRGKAYSQTDIDALAATYILEDFLTIHKEI